MNYKKPSNTTQAAVRSGVLVSLFEALFEFWPEYKTLLPRRPAQISLKGGTIRRRLYFNPDAVRENTRQGIHWPGLLLNFLNERGMAKKLAGESSSILPVPLRNGAISGLSTFTKVSGKLSEIMTAEFSPDSPDYNRQTFMLLSAALRGVCEIGMHDTWLEAKSEKLPLGRLEIIVGPHMNPDFLGEIFHSKLNSGKHSLIYVPGFREDFNNIANTRPNATLRFIDLELTGNILRGKLNPMDALGAGGVEISGKLPFIQGIFPLLDRFSSVMSMRP